MCELDFKLLDNSLKTAKTRSKYQSSQKDLSLLVPKTMKFATIKQIIDEIKPDEVVKFYPVDKYSDEELGENVSLTIRFILQREDRTLGDEDITSSMETILKELKNKLNIGLR